MADDTAAKYANLKKEAKTRGEAIKKIGASLKALPGQLAEARKDQDALEIEAVHSAAEAQVTAIEDQLLDVKLMVDDIHAIEKDKPFILAHIAEFKVVVKAISDIRNELTRQLADARTVQKDAKKADESQQDSQDDAVRDMAVLERKMESFKNVDQRLQDSKALLGDGDWAVKYHDAKFLASVQSAAKGKTISGWYSTLSKIEEDVTSLLQKYRAKGFEAKVMQDLEDQGKAILKSGADTRKLMKEIEDNLAKVADFDVPDIDMAKAAKALGIEDKAQRAELEKILGADFVDLEKKLDTLGQKLTPKAKGKNMLAELKKAKVL